MIRPSARSAIQRRTAWPPGKNGSSDEQRTSSSGWLATAGHDRSLAARSIPNGFSPSRWLPGLEDRDVELRVQVVWDGAVDRLDVRVVEQLAPVGRRAAAPGSAARTRRARRGWCRRRATISGRTPMSARCSQRAAAHANSRPIRPPPITPKRTVRSCRARRPSAARHPGRVGVLDHVAAVDDPGGALAASAPRCGARSRRRDACRRRARAPACRRRLRARAW